MVEVTEFQSPRGIEWNGDVGVVQYGPGDAGMVVMFYNHPVHNPVESAKEGRPIYQDKIYVKIHPPGERLNIIERPATGEDRQRFPRQWHQFSQQKSQVPSGTPVDLLYPEQPSIPAMLRAGAIHTVEQLAVLSANAIDNLGMGAQRYVNDAKKFLDSSSKGVGSVQFRKTIEDLESKNRVLMQQVEQLKTTVQGMQGGGNLGNLNLAALQQLLAGHMPMPPQMNQIDGATHMINNVHPTAEIAKRSKVVARKRTRLK